ncbi:phospholipase D-like domain-containing protein [Rhodopila sp.]|uniref:phospholipase D-like domain-containing protein n=1 Tax=Rhodopila sp. TaxID=2480087 RepID=UPI003D144516
MVHIYQPRAVSVVTQPEAGVGPVVTLIEQATQYICVKMFTFTSPMLVTALVAAAKRGVLVRVMLNPHRSSGSRANDETVELLRAGGVVCSWTNPAFVVTHEKSLVVDDRTVLIATFNFCEKYFSLTRDYGVVIDDVRLAREVMACFEADWAHRSFEIPPDTCLIWSNRTSRRAMCEFIDAAKVKLRIQHPKFSDVTVLDRLLKALDRGVEVRVLCGGRHGISEYDLLDTFSSLRALHRAGASVHKQHGLRTHAKLMLADDRYALLGSMNIDRSAFDLRRELGILMQVPDAVGLLAARFRADWAISSHYDAPDPLDEVIPIETDHPLDPEMAHE